MPGQAPPLPPGPPPPQPPYPQQDAQAAAHAVAWAAYYQSQGQAGATFAAPAGSATPQAGAAGASNPYANYGYSAAASAQHSAFIQGQQQAGPSFRPAGPQQPSYPAAGAQPYNAQAYGYQPPQPYGQQFPQPPQPTPGQAGYNWPTPSQPQQPYRPPPGPQGYNAPNQPFYPQQNGSFSPARPSPSPTPGPNRPYQPSARIPSGPNRPPMGVGGPGTPPHFPPAKRPRFDGPGNQNPMMGPSGPMHMQNRPPNQQPPMNAPVRPGGANMAQPGFNARPLPPSLPSAPRGPAGSIPSGPSNPGQGPGGGANTPTPPIIRPPIHLGLNGPPPPLPFGGSMRGGRPGRGGMHGNGGQGHVGGGGRNGPVNAPRGPAGMRRSEPVRQNRENDRKRNQKDREKTKEREEKITMTDFRIVGIELKALGWSWGLVGDAAKIEEVASDPVKEVKEEQGEKEEPESKEENAEESAVADEEIKKEPAVDDVKEEGIKASASEGNEVPEESAKEAEVAEVEDVLASEVKTESVDPSENIEEKRGAKRKAKTPEGDEEGSSPKKRPGEYLLTHRKPNEPSETPAQTTASSVHESNQNRFRIYFESPPELDRVPKALRRNPNKRWRRASSSVAPSVMEGRGREGTVATVTELEGVGEETNGAMERDENEAKVEEADQEGEAVNGDDVNVEGKEAVIETETGDDAVQDGSKTLDVVEAPDSEAQSAAVVEATVIGSTDEAGDGDHAADIERAEATETVVGTTEDVGDVSMMTDTGIAAAISDLVDSAEATATTTMETTETAPVETPSLPEVKAETPKIKLQGIHSLPPKPQVSPIPGKTPAPPKSASAEPTQDASTNLAASAENAASAYRSRTRRRSSVSSQGSIEDNLPEDIPNPSVNRVSILYEGSQRRLCIDAGVIETVKIYRDEGKIEVVLNKLEQGEEGKDLPKGVLVEMYDTVDQRFASATAEKLGELWKDESVDAAKEPSTSEEQQGVDTSTTDSLPSLPPLHRPAPDGPIILTVYLNKKRPLSEPKWCRNDSADEWLIEQFGAKKASTESGWKGKLKIVDPDPAPTLQSILDAWASSSSVGLPADRREFTTSLQSDPNDLLEILLRLTRGDRNPTASSSSSSSSSSALGPLATAIRADSPFANHQTHVSLAILAMYRLTTDYAAKAGEKKEVVNEKISDIIKSLPTGMIHRSLDGLFKEWNVK